MKKLLFLLITAVVLFSCTSENDLLTKNWKLDHIDPSALLSEVPAELKDTIRKIVASESDSQKGKMSFDIRKDGQIVIYSPDLAGNWEKIKGRWIYNGEAKLLTVEMKGKKDEYIVHELSESRLNIELVDRRAASSVSGVVNGQKQGTKVKKVFK